ncbi:MAG TPA: hypothetical protein VMR43_16345 [Variovorax sp.]|nr:hypothetical protein [Variovorax sp.]
MHLNPLSASSSSAASQVAPRDAAGAPQPFQQPVRLSTIMIQRAFENATTPARLREALETPGMRNTLNNLSKKELEQVVMSMAENFGERTHVMLQQLQAVVPRRANDINQIRQGDVYQNYFS